jgi:serine/threonine protein phosphatase PrpC
VPQPFRIEVAGETNVGRKRNHNEDNFAIMAEFGLFIVADGMGGHAAGEVASEMAVQIVLRELKDVGDVTDGSVTKVLGESLRHANRAIHDRTITEVDKQGMGTTASVLVLADSRYLIGQVGDSRVYLLRDGALKQLTKDHSYVQEQVDLGNLTPEQARYHPYSNVITRCVGASPDVEPDVYAGEARTGDIFLVASDGLTGMVDDRRLAQLLMSRAEPERKVQALISEANGRGGLDNITAIVVHIEEAEERAERITGEMQAIDDDSE